MISGAKQIWVHGYVLKLGFGSYNAVVNSLIAAYFKCGEAESARILFDELSDRDVVSLVYFSLTFFTFSM